MSYKKWLLAIAPVWAHRLGRDIYFTLRLVPNALYDCRRFLVYSGLNRSRNYKTEHAARITLLYHQIEKGLSLAAPRLGFGQMVVNRLLHDIERYVVLYGWEAPATTAVLALQAYIQFNRRNGYPPFGVEEALAELLSRLPDTQGAFGVAAGGTRQLNRHEIASQRWSSFAVFFNSRHSIRNFAPGAVPSHQIKAAVACAQKTPSVCNRQSWRVHVYEQRADIATLMEIQAGGRGFAANVATLLVVTCDLGCFVEISERYQAWIDGGMFAMALCLALHDQGLGSCCLNWSKEASTDKLMHDAASLPGAEQIIMLIAVGQLPDHFDVAYSYRPPVEHCLTWH
jgi:nitroreductase